PRGRGPRGLARARPRDADPRAAVVGPIRTLHRLRLPDSGRGGRGPFGSARAMHYAKFLGKSEHAVLPYLGGPFVHAEDRKLRIEGPRPALGWVRFALRGRWARAIAPVRAREDAPEALRRLPSVRGHHAHGFLARDDGGIERVWL